jgi:hypothetical protein
MQMIVSRLLTKLQRFSGLCAASAAMLAAAACGSSTSTSTAPSTISRCSVTLGATDSTVPSEGGAGRIQVASARECAWSAASETAWLSISGANSGQGDGSIEYRVAANGDPVSRRGGIVLNNQRVEISQAAGECVLQLRQPSASFPQAGGNASIDVIASSQMCTWTASTDADWITFAGSVNGKGTASVNFSVASSGGPPRTATISVANQRFSVTQSVGCTYSITPTSEVVSPAGGRGTIAISTAGGCPWVSASNVPWIVFEGSSSGSGSGVVTYSVESTGGPSRSGTMVVAGHAFSVQQAPGCSLQVSPTTHDAPTAGGTVPVAVTVATGCGWEASSSVPWITFSGASSGSGSMTVSLVVAANSGAPRNGTVTIGGQTVTVRQGQGCTFTIAPEAQTLPPAGGTGSVAVTAPSGCAWTAASNAPWLTVTQGSSGSGNGTVQFSAAATTGPLRNGTLTIADRTFTVTQGQGCTFALNPTSRPAPVGSSTGTFNVVAGTGCGWSATTTDQWITITAGASGSGNGSVNYSVAANTGPARTGRITVGGQTFTIEQADACGFAANPRTFTVPAAGQTGATVNVTAAAGCAWTAVPQATWITVTSGASGSGNGTVRLNVAASTGPERTGTALIAGLSVTFTQASGCTYSLAPTSRNIGADGGSGMFTVTPNTSTCPWTAVSNALWISLTTSSGVGTNKVEYVVQPNPVGSPLRTGTITVQGQTFTVTQAAR